MLNKNKYSFSTETELTKIFCHKTGQPSSFDDQSCHFAFAVRRRLPDLGPLHFVDDLSPLRKLQSRQEPSLHHVEQGQVKTYSQSLLQLNEFSLHTS